MTATIIPFRSKKKTPVPSDYVEFDTRDEMEKWLREELAPEDFFDFIEAYCFPQLRESLDPDMIEMLDCFINLD